MPYRFVTPIKFGRSANLDYLKHYLPIRYPDGQESTLLGLRFTVQPRHFQRGEMRLKCVATLFNVTNMRNEDMVISNRQESSGLVVVINSSGVDCIKIDQIALWITIFLVSLMQLR
ncbi:uncharacterized protein TNCV_4412401 [Trichonephila clavipes]|nr:uncharacterized protein TNCV_4412401 [Trichonephila clavipes]